MLNMGLQKGSEYQRKYQADPLVKILGKSYEENFGIRMTRRSYEHLHSTAPFTWDISDEIWETSDSDGNCEPARSPSRPKSVPLFKYKHQKYNQAYRQRQKEQAWKKKQKQTLRVKDAACDPKTPTTAHLQESSKPESTKLDLNGAISPDSDRNTYTVYEKLSEKGVQVDDDLPQKQKQGEKYNEPAKPKYKSNQPRPKKPVKGSHSQTVVQPRPMSAPLGRSLKKHIPEPDLRPPFVPYGCKDREYETSKKLTHNIRASTDIYPAALRAAKRREAEIENLNEARRNAPKKKKVPTATLR